MGPDIQFFWSELIAALRTIQAPQYQNARDQLGDHSRNTNSCHIQVKLNHQKKIQYGINHTRYEQENKRSLRIANSSQDRRTIVIQHEKWHAAEVNPHI